MEYKPDWDAVKKHMTGWWHGSDMVLAVFAPRETPLFESQKPRMPDDPEGRRLDTDFRMRHSEHAIAHAFYSGDGFPAMNHYLGPGCVALYLDCGGDFYNYEERFGSTDTVWFKPFIDYPDTAPDLRFDTGNKYWRCHLDMIRTSHAHAAGRYQVGIPNMVQNIGILASLQGMSKLLTDLINRPAFVHRFQEQILELWLRYFDDIYDVVHGPEGGCSFQAFAVWTPGRMAKVQCDRLDFSMFHLDGPTCICHVDALMEIESLNAVQWTPGSGNERMASPTWYSLYDKIRAAGKSMQLLSLRPEEIPGILDRYGREGIFISTGAPTEAEAHAILAKYGRD